MRWLPLLLLVPMLAMPVAGHGGSHECDVENQRSGWVHMRLWEATLEAGESGEKLMAWDGGCPLRADWWIVLWIDTDANVTINVEHEGSPLFAATATAGENSRFFQLPVVGFPELTITAPEGATFRAYYDQTCECPAKTAPVSGGPLWFNGDVGPGETLVHDFRFGLVRGLGATDEGKPTAFNVTIQHVTPGPVPTVHGSEWTDYSTSDPGCQESGEFQACHQYSVRSDNGGMQYILLSIEHDGDGWLVGVRPTVSVEKEAPGPTFVLLALGLLAVAWRKR